ncbi:hypothetical protein JMN32_22605 [Fulvivirga sp. 29W222]|uniref:Lipoprotein SmpA/OmlA domain-containing protein n=1 Tax=Fulvivirga marina TaxID=2494733 RepID=A0A937KG82_9BACT|nr:hypothetical protein [Fulvivirga marina]MBL6449120.1 hypothetical protein [Fulvivirga marina]
MAGLYSCNKPVDLPNFDESKWQSDHNGCLGRRLQMMNNLKQCKEHIKGLTEDEIVQVLGKPDKNELYKRNQKFYIYEIANATECESSNEEAEHIYLNIRFNATGLAKEVLIYND